MTFESNEDTSTGEPLYSKVQRFYLRNIQSEEKYRDLRVAVYLSSTFSKVSKHTLNIQVSDDDDPFFYYSLILTEDDYQRLKHLQGLLVDFESFPSQVIRLLEQCKDQESNGSKFLLFLEEERSNDNTSGVFKTCLKIVETNNFKHLCHLVLQIAVGNDNDIKKLMLKKIKVLKEQVHRGEKCIGNLESQLSSKSKNLELKEQELQDIRYKWEEDKLVFRVESTKELTEETEKLRKSQLEWQLKAQRERSELEDRYLLALKDKESEVSRLRIENQIFQEKRTLSDSAITDQARRIENLEKELTSLRSELVSVRKQNAKLDADYHEKDKMVHGLKTRLAVTEQESKDMAMLMKKHQELSNVANEQKNRLEEIICDKDKNIQRKQVTIQNLSDELVKANEIITKIQKELSVTNQKLKIRTVIALEQEKVVETKTNKISQLEEKFEENERKVVSLLESERVLKRALSELKKTVEIKNKKIRDNERVVDWLNKRLAEQSRYNYAQTNSPFLNGNTPIIPTSTPFSGIRGPEDVPLPFCVMNTTPPLDSVKNNSPKQSPELENVRNCSNVDNVENNQIQQENIKKKSSQETFKKVSDTVKQQSSIRKPPGKNAGVGFKRSTLPLSEATSVPSSYFLK